LKISKQYDCYTILDESNALGVIGKHGYGSYDYHQCQLEVDLTFCSLDKVLCGNGQFYIFNDCIMNLISENETDIFDEFTYSPVTTLSAAVAKTALTIIIDDTTEFKNIESLSSVHSRLVDNIKYWKKKCQNIGLKFLESSSAITSIIIEDPNIESISELLYKNKISKFIIYLYYIVLLIIYFYFFYNVYKYYYLFE